VWNHKLITSIEYAKNIEPKTDYFIRLSPLTRYLKMMKTGYEHIAKKKISHLLYMEDMRLIGKTEEDCKRLLEPLVMIFTWNCGLKMCK
jgi:hypothetical protein